MHPKCTQEAPKGMCLTLAVSGWSALRRLATVRRAECASLNRRRCKLVIGGAQSRCAISRPQPRSCCSALQTCDYRLLATTLRPTLNASLPAPLHSGSVYGIGLSSILAAMRWQRSANLEAWAALRGETALSATFAKWRAMLRTASTISNVFADTLFCIVPTPTPDHADAVALGQDPRERRDGSNVSHADSNSRLNYLDTAK